MKSLLFALVMLGFSQTSSAFTCQSKDWAQTLKTVEQGGTSLVTFKNAGTEFQFKGGHEQEGDAQFMLHSYELTDENEAPVSLKISVQTWIAQGGGCRGRGCMKSTVYSHIKAKLLYLGTEYYLTCVK